MPKEKTHSEVSNGRCTTNIVHTNQDGDPIKVEVYKSHMGSISGRIVTDSLEDSYIPSKRK